MLFKRKSATLAAEPGEALPQAQDQAPARPPKEKLGWFEKRDRRRRRRKVFEEVLGWILVPAIIYLIYLCIQAVGGIPKEIIDFANEIITMAMKGGKG
ncbi:putative protein OS=Bosea thiooxidans OX=53254 GN=SAMN05660750_01627 PE=4 SV=1 [Bosea thiooxidans]|uniref:Uncharacterized protein n=1 Tax=Bosea thiooxidans TaxID=53254 RepID=A0A1T5CTA5_9HYPH|nr:hypothetical protein [Bosea thiooxidans]SKB62654.1 hypothetical protein SAMN05660750_01627 [Bosea thiooxidans]